MAIVISGVNNNDRITATDGLIDSLSGFNFDGTISATTVNGNVTGNISGNNGVFGDFINVGSNIQLGQAGIITATTFDGNVSGNINNSTLLLQTGGTERVRIDSSGHILIGGSSSRTVGFAHILQLEGTITTPHSISNISNRADQHASHIDFAKSRGSSLGSTNIVQSNDYLGHILFRGADGTDLSTPASRITGAVDGTPGSNNIPGRLEFWTQASGGSIAEKVRITSSGNVGINVTDPDQKLEVDGIIKGSSYFQAGASGTNTNNWHFGAEGNGDFRLYHKNYGAGDLKITVNTNGDCLPAITNTSDLGSSSKRWRNVYTTDLQLSNEGKTNDVDGTWGNYTIQEGESELFLINNRNGKKYKFNLTEVS